MYSLETDKNETKKRLNEIFENLIELKLDEKDYDNDLLNNKIGVSPRELVYLYFAIKKEFSISIPEQQILLGKFSTFNGICEIIDTQLQLKQSC